MELTWELILLLIILGFVIGAIGAIAGMGGGGFYVAILTIFF